MTRSMQSNELSKEQKSGVLLALLSRRLSPSECAQVLSVFAGAFVRLARWAIRRREFWYDVAGRVKPIIIGVSCLAFVYGYPAEFIAGAQVGFVVQGGIHLGKAILGRG